MFHKLFFYPFTANSPPNALCGQQYSLPFVCVQSDSSHRITDKLSPFLLSVKIFGKLFSPEDSYNWMFFIHDFMWLLIMTGFVLLLSQQLNLLSSQSQRKAVCVQEKRGGPGHSASIRTNKGEGIQFQNPWTGFQKLTSLDISFVCHLILGQTGGRDV